MSAVRMTVPLVDLRAAFAPIEEEVFAEFREILREMNLFLGRNVQAFETEFAAACEAAHGIGLSNGTDALYAALRACGVGPGDEVIAPALTFFATIEAIVHAGATPVLVDVDSDTLTLDVDAVRGALSPRTRAIVPVHLFGHPADCDPLLALAREHGLALVEDAAQAHGARDRGRRCGSLGDAASWSFYFTKNLGAVGEGGFVSCNDPEIAERVRLLRHHGHVSKHEHAVIGHNLRLDELQACVLRIKLRGLDAANERRRELAQRYDDHFRDAPIRSLVPRASAEPVYHLYPVRVRERDSLAAFLAERGVGTGIHYRTPANRQPALATVTFRAAPLDVTEQACAELLSLPIYPELGFEKLDYVAGQVLDFCERRGLERAG